MMELGSRRTVALHISSKAFRVSYLSSKLATHANNGNRDWSIRHGWQKCLRRKYDVANTV